MSRSRIMLSSDIFGPLAMTLRNHLITSGRGATRSSFSTSQYSTTWYLSSSITLRVDYAVEKTSAGSQNQLWKGSHAVLVILLLPLHATKSDDKIIFSAPTKMRKKQVL